MLYKKSIPPLFPLKNNIFPLKKCKVRQWLYARGGWGGIKGIVSRDFGGLQMILIDRA
jgi:hypothetical protein